MNQPEWPRVGCSKALTNRSDEAHVYAVAYARSPDRATAPGVDACGGSMIAAGPGVGVSRQRCRPRGITRGVWETGSSMIWHGRPKTSSTSSAVTMSAGRPVAITLPSRIAMMWSA